MLSHFLVLLCLLSGIAGQMANADTVVTTYVHQTQEKRDSTRWTLTEWMRIKERIKLMDVWLAMNSGKEEQRFAPEVTLGYTAFVPESSRGAHGVDAQFWLTNLFSSVLRISVLNIDFGIGGDFKRVGELNSLAQTFERDRSSGSLPFRVFGRHSQDTSLEFSAGRFLLHDPATASMQYGPTASAKFQAYLLRWFGLDAKYTWLGNADALFSGQNTGRAYAWGGFAEVACLRLGVHVYQEQWSSAGPSFDEKGLQAGLQLLL